jgi:hypothetical protein
MREEGDVLEYIADASVFDLGQADGFTVDEHLAAVWFVDASDAPNQCALAAPARSQYAYILLVFNVKRYVA